MPWGILGIALISLLVLVPVGDAAEPLVVSTWGANWKETIDRVVSKPFTAKTGVPVEYEVGNSVVRLSKARVAKGTPLVDVTWTTTHVGRLYMSDGLLEKLDLSKIPNAREIAREAIRSDYHLGVWAYVFTVAYRPDMVKGELTSWADLWSPALVGKLSMPDFDPSHIITIAALMEGANEVDWQKGQERLRKLKPNIAAFWTSDGHSQDLMKTGQAPVQVMLSVNAYHLRDQGMNVKVVQTRDFPPIVGIDTIAVMAGTKRSDLAHQYINIALSKEAQAQFVEAFKVGPVHSATAVPAKLQGQPGIFLTAAEWKERGYIINDDVRAKNLPIWREWFMENMVKK